MEKTNTYFAAANGYSGFRSYFKEIFDSGNFDRIYVLKGGPGTGKNTLMRKLSELKKIPGVALDQYFCSSDPKSLDGIVLSTEKRRVGILDGTAPHERDAVIPGAVDTIVNLGENFDENKLEKCRSQILHITERKKQAFREGYLYLSIAGKTNEAKAPLPSYILEKFTKQARSLLPLANEKAPSSVRLKTAFCHLGFVTLPYAEHFEKIVKIDGDPLAGTVFMKILVCELKKRDLSFVSIVSPLSEDIIDAVHLQNGKIRITRKDGEQSADVREVITLKSDPFSRDNAVFDSCEKVCLQRAQAAFSEASRAHFELEEIYKAAMNYKRNEAQTEMLTERVGEILSRP